MTPEERLAIKTPIDRERLRALIADAARFGADAARFGKPVDHLRGVDYPGGELRPRKTSGAPKSAAAATSPAA